MNHYGSDKPGETLEGEQTTRKGFVSSDINTEWKTYCQFMAKKPKDCMKEQLRELVSNEILQTMFPNLHTLATISVTIPACVYCISRKKFSQMKFIKPSL